MTKHNSIEQGVIDTAEFRKDRMLTKHNISANRGYDIYFETDEEAARWADEAEMTQVLSPVDLKAAAYRAGGIPLLQTSDKTIWVDNEDTHSIIFGSTGSKKTRLFCMPLCHILARAGESMVVTDPKGELYRDVGGELEELGYQTVVLNFRDPLRGDGWNPLHIIAQLYRRGDIDQAVAMLSDFVEAMLSGHKVDSDPFWHESARRFCLGALLILLECAPPERVNMNSLAQLRILLDARNSGEYGSRSPLETFMSQINQRTMAYVNLSGVLNAPKEKTLPCITTMIDELLNIFVNQLSLSYMLAHNSFDMTALGRGKTAIFLVIPDEKETLHFLVTMFVKQCYEALIGEAQRYPHSSLPVRVNFVLDEFANIPAIPDMAAMISAARSRNIRFTLVVQNPHQLEAKYGANAQTIKGNCENWVFLASKEMNLLKEISALCGERYSYRTPDRKVPLISIAQLQRLNKQQGEALILHQRQYPFMSYMPDIAEYNFPPYEAPELMKKNYAPVPVFDLVQYMADPRVKIKNLFKREWSSGAR